MSTFLNLSARFSRMNLIPATGKLTWVKRDRKNSLLFLGLLRRVHLIVDNYGIHDSQ